MLFRIEDISGFGALLRTYDADEFSTDLVSKAQIDEHIASKIRKEVNGAKSRSLLSYSKSLATCILKYNKYTDNELHICITNGLRDYILYISPRGNKRCKHYSIQDRIDGEPLFNGNGKIQLVSFIIDISDNSLIDEYLKRYAKVGKKALASPEKDSEVVVMNPPNDLIINQYIDAVYILYALQLKYHFLCDEQIRAALIKELYTMDEFRFLSCPYERIAFVNLISYLSSNWQYEHEISKGIYDYSQAEEHISAYYDPILQFHGIMQGTFEDSYNLGSYNENVLSDLFWRYCGKYLGYQM